MVLFVLFGIIIVVVIKWEPSDVCLFFYPLNDFHIFFFGCICVASYFYIMYTINKSLAGYGSRAWYL